MAIKKSEINKILSLILILTGVAVVGQVIVDFLKITFQINNVFFIGVGMLVVGAYLFNVNGG